MDKNIAEEIKMNIDEPNYITEVFGSMDANLKLIKSHFSVEVIQRNGTLILKGDDALIVQRIFNELFSILKSGDQIDSQKVDYIIGLEKTGQSYKTKNIGKDVVCITHTGKPIKPKTIGQKHYAKSIKKNDIVFGIGPAGTGKTFLAIAMAISAFKNKEVNRIILSRPAVEAGERLGFLPGDLQEKVDPYLRPLYDSLNDILGRETVARYREKEMIEIVPLAYMRGRTLDNAFIILDEAQNTTKEQMKMFLTRMGFGSKVIITGDVTQIDLPRGKDSGLKEASRILQNVEGIGFTFLTDSDVVRHKLVQKIINAYESNTNQQNSKTEDEKGKGRNGDTI